MTMIFPTLPLQRPDKKVSSHPKISVLEVESRQVPVFQLRVKDKKLFPLLAHFPIQWHAIRTAYLPPKTRSTLKLSSKSDLLIEARMPEWLGKKPLAHWELTGQEVATMAEANASSGVLMLQIENRKTPLRRIFTPYWLDWQGWSGFAYHLAHVPQLVNEKTLSAIAYELEARGEEPPTGLYTARALLFHALEDAEASAEACQQAIWYHLDQNKTPSVGIQDALVLLCQLLKAYDELDAARAASMLALWLNANHQQANIEMLPFLSIEEDIVAALARLSNMPHPPANYKTLLQESAERMETKPKELEKRVKGYARDLGYALWSSSPTWLDEVEPGACLEALGL